MCKITENNILGHDANVGDIIAGGIYPAQLVILTKCKDSVLSHDRQSVTKYTARYINKREKERVITIYSFYNYYIVQKGDKAND